jgi:hypothetical protein
MTCAPLTTANSMASATESCKMRITLSMARIDICFAFGATPVTLPAAPLISTLAVAVPCPGFPM